jgi:hypothetical protein
MHHPFCNHILFVLNFHSWFFFTCLVIITSSHVYTCLHLHLYNQMFDSKDEKYKKIELSLLEKQVILIRKSN